MLHTRAGSHECEYLRVVVEEEECLCVRVRADGGTQHPRKDTARAQAMAVRLQTCGFWTQPLVGTRASRTVRPRLDLGLSLVSLNRRNGLTGSRFGAC